MIVLVGFMGAGKTTIGYVLAEKLGLPFVDIDVLIEQHTRRSISTIFEEDGERAFRALEYETVVETLRGPSAVVALGGGAVEHPATRRELEDVNVVHLEVSYEEALLRIGHDAYRPMLSSPDVRGLYDRRRPIYRQVATIPMPTDGRRPEAIVLDILTRVTTPASVPPDTHSVLVAPMGGAYQVHIGPGLVSHLAELLPPLPLAERAYIVADAALPLPVDAVTAGLRSRGLDAELITVPAGEAAKTFSVAEEVTHQLAELAAHRDDLIVGMGGESICDLAGFVAATYNRGMPLALVPTTLLAQVDSAIGGKNAINLAHGRNLVGTIHQPIVVISDVEVVTPSRGSDEFRSGLAELVKHALIADPELLETLRLGADPLLRGDLGVLVDVISRSVTIKAGIVTVDEREEGERVHLNYGHTFAHAIEQVWGLPASRHGEAVSIGMMAAAYLARRMDRVGDDVVRAHRDALTAFDLPIQGRLDLEAMREAWLRDKKYRGGVRFVLLNGVGRPEGGVVATEGALAAALDDLAA